MNIVWNSNYGIFTREGELQWLDIAVAVEIFHQNSYDLSKVDGPVHRVIDIGAHIGCFALHAYHRWPDAQIICVEPCPENWRALKKNAPFAHVLQDACTYEQGPLTLLNCFVEDPECTGGSKVVPAGTPFPTCRYREEGEALQTITLDALVGEHWVTDVLKLDCEGSEYSILENAQCLDRVRHIFGEYHDPARWRALVDSRFSDWVVWEKPMGNKQGLFHLHR